MTSRVQTRAVVDNEAGLRLDRWFQRHFPELGHGALQKLLRTGQVRIDGKRAEGKDRVEPGQTIRLPPGVTAAPPPKPREIPTVSDRDAQEIRGLVIHKDDHVIVLNKPPGLAVQGGTGTERHVDGMLDALRFGYEERPRLVHRLDKDTSGLLLVARTGQAAKRLANRSATARRRSFTGRSSSARRPRPRAPSTCRLPSGRARATARPCRSTIRKDRRR